jgi:ketosteroid isomerase-like protein
VWFRARCPVVADEQRWIDDHLAWFVDRFGTSWLRSPVVTPTDEFFPGSYSATGHDVRRAVATVCTHSGCRSTGWPRSSQRREAVEAFLRAAREGDFGALLRLLDPEVELRADADVVAAAAPHADRGAPLLTSHARGADAVARIFAGRARETEWVEIGAAYAPGGVVSALFSIRFRDGRITRIDVIGEAGHLADPAATLP